MTRFWMPLLAVCIMAATPAAASNALALLAKPGVLTKGFVIAPPAKAFLGETSGKLMNKPLYTRDQVWNFMVSPYSDASAGREMGLLNNGAMFQIICMKDCIKTVQTHAVQDEAVLLRAFRMLGPHKPFKDYTE